MCRLWPPGSSLAMPVLGDLLWKWEEKNTHYNHVMGDRWSSADPPLLLTEAVENIRPQVGALFMLRPLAFAPYLTYSHTTCMTFHCILIKWSGVEPVNTDECWNGSWLLKPWGLHFCQRGRDAERGVADGTARPVVKQISALGLCNVKVWARALAGGVEVSDFNTTIILKVGFYVCLCMIM